MFIEREVTNLKILFISDIHGIKNNLQYIEKIINSEKIDKLVVLGDLYYSGPNFNNSSEVTSSYVKNFLTKHQNILICLRGNCDSDVDIKASDFPICNNLVLICTPKCDIYCTHGNEYNIEKNKKFENKKGVLIYGHEHYPYIKNKDNMFYINTGSISLPRNGSEPSYTIYCDGKFIIYDINGTVIDELLMGNFKEGN